MRTPAELPTPGGSYGRAYGVRWLTLPPTSLSHDGPHPRGAVGGGGRGADGGRGTGAVSETLARAPPWLFSAESDLSPVVWQPHVGEVGDPPRYDRTACRARLIDRNGRAHAMGTADAHARAHLLAPSHTLGCPCAHASGPARRPPGARRCARVGRRAASMDLIALCLLRLAWVGWA